MKQTVKMPYSKPALVQIPPGSEKYERVMALLKKMYGNTFLEEASAGIFCLNSDNSPGRDGSSLITTAIYDHSLPAIKSTGPPHPTARAPNSEKAI